MSYLLTLSDTNSERIEAMAKKERVHAQELIEKIIVGYLDSPTTPQSPDQAGLRAEIQDIAGIKDLYKWEEQRGVINFTPVHKRVFVMTARSWDSVEQDLYTKLRKGASPLLSDMGFAYGLATALDYRSITGSPEDFAGYLEHLGRTAGWGKFSLSGDLTEGSKIIVRVENCVFCRSRNASIGRSDPCQFLMGVCKGIASTVFDSAYYVEETKCCAKANEYCEILIGKAGDSERAPWSVGSGISTLTR